MHYPLELPLGCQNYHYQKWYVGFAWLENNIELNDPRRIQDVQLNQINSFTQISMALFHMLIWPTPNISLHNLHMIIAKTVFHVFHEGQK
jgi:hypothetical protein